MREYRYTPEDRRIQLKYLASALPGLISVVQNIPELRDLVPYYEEALSSCRELLQSGFDQARLTAFSRTVPDAFCRHKEWYPPVVQRSDGSWAEVEWFRELESRLQPVLRGAEVLREIGFY